MIAETLTETVTDHYLLAGLWADAWDADGELIEDAHVTYSPPDVNGYNGARESVAAFLALAADDAEAWAIVTADPAQAGHDLWLSAGGHGAGFWDRGHGEAGDRLHAYAKSIGSAMIHVDSDGPSYENAGGDDRPMSWGEVADRSAAGLCPASHGYSEPHIVTDGATCDECGATV